MSALFMIGMPGCGKTFWGQKIAEAYELKWFDLDALIEKQKGKTISAIFEDIGEEAFRKLERQVLKDILKKEDDFVLSCGGGTPTILENFNLLKQEGCTVYLEASIPFLLSNLEKEPGKRPLLQKAESMEQELAAIFEKRKRIYELAADFIMPAEAITVNDFKNVIETWILQE